MITLRATDKDSVKFGKLYYNITIFGDGVGSNLHFIRINHFKGSIHMTQSMDREKYLKTDMSQYQTIMTT